MEKWYQIKEDVEYSTDLDFFNQHQIGVVHNGETNETTFFSRLENKAFVIKKNIFAPYLLTPVEEIKIIVQIHADILNGIYGVGKLVD